MAYTISTTGDITITADTEDLYAILNTEQPTNGTSANAVTRSGDTRNPHWTFSRILVEAGATLTFNQTNSIQRGMTVELTTTNTNGKIEIAGTFEFGIVTRDGQGNPTEDVQPHDADNRIIMRELPNASIWQGNSGLFINNNGTFIARGGSIEGSFLGFWNLTPTNSAFDIVGTTIISSDSNINFFRVTLPQNAVARSRIKQTRIIGCAWFPGGNFDVADLELNDGVTMNGGSDTRTYNIFFDNLQMPNTAFIRINTNVNQAPTGCTIYLRNGELTYNVASRINNTNASRGTVLTTSFVDFLFRDVNLQPIEGAQFRATDTDNNTRRSSIENDNATDTFTGDPVIHHWNRDLVFSGNSNANGILNFEFPKVIWNSPRSSPQANLNGLASDNRLPYNYKIRHYSYNLISSQLTANSFTIGANTVISDVGTIDSYVTSNVSVASNIAGIAIDSNLQTITVTQNRTLDELYDYWKYWIVQLAQFDVDPFTTSGAIFDLDDWDVTGAEFLSSGTKITTIRTTGSVTQTDGGTDQITVSFLDTTLTGQTQLIVLGLPEGNALYRRVIVTRTDTNPHEELFDNRYDGTGTSTSHTFTTNYTQNIPVQVKFISVDWKTIETSLTLVEGRNFLTLNREISYGVDGTGVRAAYQINSLTTGTEINTNSNTAIFTANNTIVIGGNPNVDSNVLIPLRQAVSDAKYAWARNDELGGANISPPFDLDDVRGLAVYFPWTISTVANIKTEGWFRRFPTDGGTLEANYVYTIENSPGNVKSRLIYNGVEQQPFYMDGNTTIMTRVLPIDINIANVRLKASQKIPDKVFLVKDFLIRDPATTRYVNNLTNGDTNFSVQDDINVTESLPDNPALRGRLPNLTIVQDSDGVDHAFTEVLEVQNGTDTRQKLINELAAIAAYDDFYDEKPYTLQANLRVDLPAGTFVRLKNGTDLVGEVTGFIGLFSNNGGQYGYPIQRLMTLRLSNAYTGGPISYVVTRSSTVGIDGTDPVIVNDGSMYGNLSTDSRSVTLGINSSSNLSVTIHYFGSNVQYGTTTGTISSELSLVEITPIAEPIQLYKNQTQTVDNQDAGTRAWDTNINNISFNWADREIIIPNSYTVFDVSKAYRAWRNELESNSLRAIYGHAIRGVNQAKQPTISGNVHLYSPLLYFNDSWSLDVEPTRPISSALQLSGGDLQREDQEHFGLIYNSPLAVNIKPSFNLVQGVTTDFEACTTTTLSDISSEVNGNIQTILNYAARIIRNEVE